MKEFINKNFSVLLIAALIVFLWTKGIFKPSVPQDPKIIKDTAYVIGQAPVQQYTPPVVVSIPPATIPQQYKPDTTYMGILRQYKELIEHHFSKNIVNDTLHLKDSAGKEFATVPIQDTVSQNAIQRKFSYTYRFPVITNTIIQPYKSRTQLYYGFEVTSPISGILGIQQLSAGLILKNKKDNILKANVGYNFPMNAPFATLGYYPKLHF